MQLLGYNQPFVAHAGETVEVKVSTALASFSAEAVRVGDETRPAEPQVVSGTYRGRQQEVRSGSYLTAPLHGAPLTAGHSVQFWFYPTLLTGRRTLIAGLGQGGGWEVAVDADRRLSAALLSADGDVRGEVSAGPAITERRWYFAAVTWDADGTVTLAIAPRDPQRQDAMPVSSGGVASGPVASGPLDLGGPCPAATRVTVGAAVPDDRPTRCFDGKIDSPRLFAGPLSAGQLSALAADAPAARVGRLRHEWLLGPEGAQPPHRVRDAGPGRCDGVLVNMPALGVTGRNWTPATESFNAAPEQYRAAHFHSDDLSDAGWETSLRFTVPAEWDSGVYGIRLRAADENGEHEDVVPLIVSATGKSPADRPAVAVLLPTFSYLAYANEHASWERPIKSSLEALDAMVVTELDQYMARHRLLSLYDLHADGSGTCLSSWRRPVLNMRPGYSMPLVAGPHQFPADMELLAWLDSRGVDYDVITDDDLHCHGLTAVEPYQVVLTGSHPEYTSTEMLDGLDAFLAGGGRLMYLGGNGFYWVTTALAGDPWAIEVRRGMAGSRVWESPAGEWHQTMTGEHGGIWRHRGRAPQVLTGVGFTAQGFDKSLDYNLCIRPDDERAGWILDGIDPDAPLGGAGSVLGGPAGFEIDRADPGQGTPPGTVLVATAQAFSDAYQGAVEDVTTADSQQGGSVSELVRSDVVFFETPAAGAVFSVGSIAWCGALRDPESGQETPVGTMTWNVMTRFADPRPFTDDRQTDGDR
jgi:N,N-dimethylformamidase